MIKWIEEIRNEEINSSASGDFLTAADFNEIIRSFDTSTKEVVQRLSEIIVGGDNSYSYENMCNAAVELDEKIQNVDVLISVACALSLAVSPEVRTWKKVRSIAVNSWEVEHWLTEAMLSLAQSEPALQLPYISLAELIFGLLENDDLPSEFDRATRIRDESLAHWRQTEYQLEALWDGISSSSYLMYESEMRLFDLLYQLDPSSFVELASKSTNPFLIDSALLAAGIGAFSPKFTRWASCVAAAPTAFSEDGTWTKSILLPLLLLHARNHLMEPGNRHPKNDNEPQKLEALNADVRNIAGEVARVISDRVDAKSILHRWGTWLMRQIVRTQDKYADIRSQSFVDNLLVETLGSHLGNQPLGDDQPTDLAPWEPWCYRCLRSSLAYERLGSPQSFTTFAAEWHVTPENWMQQFGRTLVTRASVFTPPDDTPGMFAHLLAFPLASCDEFPQAWQAVWRNATYLREVLEFGSPDATSDEYADRASASDLLLLLSRIGLALLDQAASNENRDQRYMKANLSQLHEALASATLDVLTIDNTLNRTKWKSLLQHIGLRRFVWSREYTDESRPDIFSRASWPDSGYYLQTFSADPTDLLSFLNACLQNGVAPDALRAALDRHAIDLEGCLKTLHRLNELSAYRYPLDRGTVNAVSKLIERRV